MSEGWSHEFDYPIQASAARIFEALTNEDELERWFAEHARVERRVGGAFRFWGKHTVGTPAEDAASGSILALEPEERLAFEWTVCGTPSSVTVTLSPEESSEDPATRVAILHELEGVLDLPRPKELIDDWWRFSVGNLSSHATGKGEVMRPDFADDSPQIELSLRVDAPPAAVFRALTEPEALRDWMYAPAPVVEPRVGGRWDPGWSSAEDIAHAGAAMEILEIVEDRLLVTTWPDWRGDPSVPTQRVSWSLEPDGDGTRVTLVHSGFVRTADFSDYPFGWGHFMSEMARVAIGYA